VEQEKEKKREDANPKTTVCKLRKGKKIRMSNGYFPGSDKKHDPKCLVPYTLAVIIVSFKRNPIVSGTLVTTCLMVERDGMFESTVEACISVQVLFLHLRVRACSACKVSIPAHRRRVQVRASSKIVFEGSGTMTMTRARVERRVRSAAGTVSRDRAVIKVGGWGSPVRVKTSVEVLGPRKFPFTEDSPKDGNTTDGGTNDDEDGDGHALAIVGNVGLTVSNGARGGLH
jgi:hypothetical protein